MGNILLIYVIVQLITNAYGISVIVTLKPIVNRKLLGDGYVLKNSNSMYKFNDKIEIILKGFIPLYYASKALQIVRSENPIENSYNNEIKEGNYITVDEAEDQKARMALAKKFSHVKVKSDPILPFEKPYFENSYKARPINFDLLTSSKDSEYKIVNGSEADMSMTPFGIVNKPEPVVIIKPVGPNEIVESILNLSPDNLELLGKDVIALSEIRRKKQASIDKAENQKKLFLDVA